MTKTLDFGQPARVKVTLVRSTIGEPPKARGTVRALGLRKTGSSRTHQSSPSLAGMLERVRHLVTVDPLPADPNGLAPTPGLAGDGVMQISRSDDIVHVAVQTRMSPREADARIHRVASALRSTTSTAVLWDEGTACLRRWTSEGDSRPWLTGDKFRYALLRVDSDFWAVGIEPPLTRKRDPVVLHFVGDVEVLDELALLVQQLAGEDESNEFQKRAKEEGWDFGPRRDSVGAGAEAGRVDPP